MNGPTKCAAAARQARALRKWCAGALGSLALALGGCDGENLFQSGGGIGVDDRRDPIVTIMEPDSGQRVAVGDSLLLRVRVRDEQGIARLEIIGFSVTGSQELGTSVARPRFESKVVDLSDLRPVVRDTVLVRYLVATGDSLPADTAFVVARVQDLSGNEVADTMRISIGGPKAQIRSPAGGSEVRPGAQLRVHLVAADSATRLQSVRLRASGQLVLDSLLRFDPARTRIDTIINVTVPATASVGEVHLRAIARNAVNDSTTSPVVMVRVLAPAADTNAPSVRFQATAATRAELADSVAVTVKATDDIAVTRVGVTLVAIHRLATRTDTLGIVSYGAQADSATFRATLGQLGVPTPTDTSTVRIEVTAFAFDAAGNCATAVVPATDMSQACPAGNPVRGIRAGAQYEVLVVRGRTLYPGGAGDRIVDLAADDTHLYLSNLTRNRLEVLPIGSTTFQGPILVGSRPWGLAFNRSRNRLYVANSGGTNLSVVSPATRSEIDRIQTPNVKLYDVAFDARIVADPNNPLSGDSITGYFPNVVTRYDYSDRPQFVGVTLNENLIFSTVPTSAARDGTVRVYRRSQERLELVTDYAEDRLGSKVVIANADSAFLVPNSPFNLIRVCPRNRSRTASLDRNLPQTCYTGPINTVEETIESIGYDTRFHYGLNIAEIGLSDTTFVAVSGDHSTIAIGEGARQNARVVSFVDAAGTVDGPLVKFGEIRDLVGNAAEHVIGIGLNSDGSLGIARGAESYFFSRDLRLQGFVNTESGSGGVEMHPDDPVTRRAFVPGVEPSGLAFVDVMDSFHFRRIARIFVRDPLVGPVRAARAPGGTLKLYGITTRGLVALDVNPNDL